MPAAIVAWAFGIACGCIYGIRYETTATETESAGERWPATSLCTLSTRHPTLVMFVHRYCPCSRASLNELAWLVENFGRHVDAQVVFYQPPSLADHWPNTDLWSVAAGIPGVTLHVDLDGAEQQRFGARASGEVFLYRPGGGLAFHGGITAARGHAGDSQGRAAVAAILNGCDLSADATPVFGCELQPRRADCPDGEAGVKRSRPRAGGL